MAILDAQYFHRSPGASLRDYRAGRFPAVDPLIDVVPFRAKTDPESPIGGYSLSGKSSPAGFSLVGMEPGNRIVYRSEAGTPAGTAAAAATRGGVEIHPGDLAARVASGDFDPTKDYFLDPVMGPIPFGIVGASSTSTPEGDTGNPAYLLSRTFTFAPKALSPVEQARARTRRIAGQAQGHRRAQLASRAQRPAALAGLEDTLGAGSPQLGARASLSGLS